MKGEENIKPESGKLTVKISGVDQFLTVVRPSSFEHKILKINGVRREVTRV